MRDADDSGFSDSRMTHEHFFHLGREHVESRHDDQILGSIEQIEIAVSVDRCDVAGVEPTVVVEHTGRRRSVVPVANEDVLPANEDFPTVSGDDVAAVGVDHPDLDAWDDAPDRLSTRFDADRTGDDG
jgi:hypothetical protein